ncbi:MAG TPA: AbgT family transporter [Trebonia sp.]
MGESSAPDAGPRAADATETTTIPGPREANEPAPPDQPGQQGSGGFLGIIERAGDKIPHPVVLFLILCAVVIVLSLASLLFFLAWYGLGIPLGPGAPVRL